jgi:23S rRNA (cytosine1962-C5)-methyltransferase
VDLRTGQKTGFYIDQRLNRQAVARHATGKRVLDLFCYTGAFACSALAAGAAEAVLVDSSPGALALAEENLALAGVVRGKWEIRKGNAFEVLRSFRDRGESFDLIVVDPPKLAPTRAHALRAGRAYKDLNLLAFKLCRPGGSVATFSCSAGIDAATFRTILSWAAVDAEREVHVLERYFQPPDHPVSLRFLEGEYLKGFLCRVE